MNDNLKEVLLGACIAAVAIVCAIRFGSCAADMVRLNNELDKFKIAAAIVEKSTKCNYPAEAPIKEQP